MQRPVAVWIIAGILLITVSSNGHAARLGDAAPELTGRHWLNSPPLTIAGLKGRVVLLEFWTYG
jgi:hypothetical protein